MVRGGGRRKAVEGCEEEGMVEEGEERKEEREAGEDCEW
jgi:hypothetical protein